MSADPELEPVDEAEWIAREFDPVAELAVLAAVMRSGGRIIDDLPVQADDFGQPANAAAFARLVELYRAAGHVDYVAFASSLATSPIIGVKAHELLEAERHAPHIASAEYHARTIREWSIRRAVRAAGSWVTAHAGSADDVDALVDEARARLDAACAGASGDVSTIGSTIYETLAELEDPDVHTPTPWPSLDFLLGGLRPGALYTIGARPGKGKSVVACQLALHMARHGRWAAVSSLEMTRHELNRRWIAQSGRVSMTAMERRQMSRQDWAAAGEVASALADLPIAVDDRSSVTAWDVRHHARSVSRRGALGVVIVDYLQLMNAPRSGERRSRQEQVAEMSRSMKQLAKELAVPVVVLSQLNRESESRPDGRPRISDLRESGAVEQDSDVVILLHRDQDKSPDRISFGVPKNRHGQCGSVDLQFEGHYSRILEPRWTPSAAL